MKRILLTFGLCMLMAGMSFGQTILEPGDISIIGLQADTPDSVSFLILKDLEATTEFLFTDNGVFSNGTFRETEGIIKYTASGTISAGTIISWGANLSLPVNGFSEEDAGLNLSASGDQIVVYQVNGADTNFVSILDLNGGFVSTASSSNNSAIPPNLREGVNALSISPHVDNAVYDESITSGTKSELNVATANSANFNTSGSANLTFPSASYTVSSNPSFAITGTEGWRMLSTPTSNNTYDDLLGDLWTQGIGAGADVSNGTASVQLYNTSTDNFAAATDLGATMTAGTGFITFVYSDDDYTNSGADAGFPKTLSLSGTENSGDVSPTLNTEGDAFTLVGNPYASTIDWDLISRTDVTGTVYVYDNADSGYDTWNGTTGDLTDGLIATYQGFWVQNTSGSPTPSLTIQEADKSTGGTFRKDVKPSTIKLTAEMEELSANAHFSFTSTGEIGKDNFDGLRLDPLDFKEFLSISTVVGDEQLSINNLPSELNEEVTIPMDVEAFTTAEEGWIPKGGEITLTWPELKNLPEHWEITLTDYKTGITTNVRTESSYTFIAEEAKGKVKPKTMYSMLSPVSVVKSKSTNESSRFGITLTPSTSVSIDDEIDAPTEFTLGQNYPNPFNPTTNINYSVGEAGPVNITVYNVMGQKVAELLNTTKNAGSYQLTWNATGVASGIYYYRLTAPGQVLTRQMTLIK
ncbi:MAG: T9SS type A sorting domain-containing protein [Balneola sp.]|nr:T9SS type A sorting domain-containing protein [Balneola sp.]